jgi:hypothetical protein
MWRLFTFLVAIALLALLAGLYGALHDQVSFTVAPEYFTLFKYQQFGFEPEWFGGHRQTVAVIGFLATWWVGLLIGFFLGGTALLQPSAHAIQHAIKRGAMITLSVAAVCALIGLGYGWYFAGHTVFTFPEKITDPHAFFAVGTMHNFSYGGGVLGLIIAITDMEWRRNKRRVVDKATA